MRELKRTGADSRNPYRTRLDDLKSRPGRLVRYDGATKNLVQKRMADLAAQHEEETPAPQAANRDSDPPVNWFEIPRHAAFHLANSIDKNYPPHIVHARRAMFTRAISGGYGPEALSEYLAASKGLDSPSQADQAQNGAEEH